MLQSANASQPIRDEGGIGGAPAAKTAAVLNRRPRAAEDGGAEAGAGVVRAGLRWEPPALQDDWSRSGMS